MIACYHYGNFEWLSLACGFLDLKGTIISQEFKNSLLDPIFKKLREQSGHELVPRERGIIRLYKVLRRKGRTALLVDLTVPPTQGAVAINCFGLKTSVTSAHAWLHEQTGVPIIPAHCEPLPDGRCRIVFHPKIEVTAEMTHQEIAQACWNSFEPYARKNPAPWLWMYKHWRYLPGKPRSPLSVLCKLLSTVRRPASTREVVAASLRRGALGGITPTRRQPPSRCFGVPGSAVATTSRSRNGKGVRRGANAFPICLGA